MKEQTHQPQDYIFGFNYRGCLVKRLIGGYSWQDKKYKTLVELDQAIDKGIKTIEKSLQKISRSQE